MSGQSTPSLRATEVALAPRFFMPGSPMFLPGLVTLLLFAAMLVNGPVAQLVDYHRFADQRFALGLPHALDVLSNLGFLLVGGYGMMRLKQSRKVLAMDPSRAGYRLFFLALMLTAAGSGWYHLAPDNARLVWDRLPIALACAGLLAAVCRDTCGGPRALPLVFAALASASVAWWRYTDLQGADDLGPYLLVQILPLVLIPLMQWQVDAPARQRRAYGIALGLYLLAKVCEVADHALFDALLMVSGHTLKHLLAAAAAMVITVDFSRQLAAAKRLEPA